MLWTETSGDFRYQPLLPLFNGPYRPWQKWACQQFGKEVFVSTVHMDCHGEVAEPLRKQQPRPQVHFDLSWCVVFIYMFQFSIVFNHV